MLCYAFTPLSQDGYDYVEKEQFENIHELFAAILSKGISRQLKQGLYREYVECREDVVTMRGRLICRGRFGTTSKGKGFSPVSLMSFP